MTALLDTAARPAACLHCAGPLPEGTAEFCCTGCAGAYALVRSLGLDAYYDRRDANPAAAPRPEAGPAIDPSAYVVDHGDGSFGLSLLVDGLHCAACVWLLETALGRQPDVTEARVNLTARRLRLRWRGGAARAGALMGLVSGLGYRAVPYDSARLATAQAAEEKALIRALAVAGFAAVNVMLLSVSVWSGYLGEMGEATRALFHWVSALIAMPAVAYAGRPFFASAWSALKAGRTNMDVPISIGVTLATGMSLFETIVGGHYAYFDGAVSLLFFLLIGRVLDHRARGRARSAAEHLIGLSAAPVTVLDGEGTPHPVPANQVRRGDTVLVAAGERIGVDGTVAEGRGAVDSSLVTGESVPQPVEPGSGVHAGMVNLGGPLRLTVAAAGEGTLLAEIVRLMEAAEQGRSRFVVLADRVARRYAPVVHLLALTTAIGWVLLGLGWHDALMAATAVLIITCPCALGLAVPVVQVVASGRLLRRGLLLKSATALERLAEVDTVVFDKTGTLTLGRPELCPEHPVDPAALRAASGLAAASRHPLSQALRRACPGAPATPGVAEIAGSGLEAAGVRLGSRAFCGIPDRLAPGHDGQELWLARPGQPPVRFAFRDALRPEAAATVARLRDRGLSVELLSGDRTAAVAAVAGEVGIDTWSAHLAPADKCARLAALAAAGRKVLMVGDGLNDAPALAAAHVSLSPATAADVSQVAADAVFQGQSLAAVTELLGTARRSARLCRQNVALAILYNVFAVPLAMVGLVTPLIAAVSMSASSILVVANGLRLAGGRK
ncbi:MAG TPA: heavy metal translocating P-type ATPase metal-binding domain-containing protein [Alphaproteobacteria bacterium]|nr:heavy metal translocating P-type ATPase metal-binding domain-containing protein [Alphaproteobacteria bacterium]